MPNHITNHIKLEGDRKQIAEMLEAIKVDELGIGTVDFEKIIPMPESLKIKSGTMSDRGYKHYQAFVKVYTLGGTINMDKLTDIPKESEEVFLEERKDIDRKEFELGRTVFFNVMNHGARTWYDWSIINWGTKWNAYGYDEGRDYSNANPLEFLTAWSAPHPVIQKLSEMFPDIEITHEWADEDIGMNCGRCNYLGGERIEEYYPESEVEQIRFAARVMEIDPQDYGLYLNASETGYITMPDEDFELIEVAEQTALFTNQRMTSADIPSGLYCYHLRHSDDGERFATLEEKVTVNFGGTVITKEPIDIGKEGYLTLSENTSPNFLGETCDMVDYIADANGQEEMEVTQL